MKTLATIEPPRIEATPRAYLCCFVAGKPVSVNRMYTVGRGRNRYGRRRTEATLVWQQLVWYGCARERSEQHHQLQTPLRVELEFFQLRSNCDADNYVKATLDAISQALDVDDRHVYELTVRKAAWVKGRTQGVMITVWEASA